MGGRAATPDAYDQRAPDQTSDPRDQNRVMSLARAHRPDVPEPHKTQPEPASQTGPARSKFTSFLTTAREPICHKQSLNCPFAHRDPPIIDSRMHRPHAMVFQGIPVRGIEYPSGRHWLGNMNPTDICAIKPRNGQRGDKRTKRHISAAVVIGCCIRARREYDG